MSYLLEAYQRVIGSKYVKQQGNGYNGPCPLCGGAHSGKGRSDRFMVWPERSERVGEACAEHGINGAWYCRRCGASGDTIAFMLEVEGLSFKEALAELGIQGKPKSKNRPLKPKAAPAQDEYYPRDWVLSAPDPAAWQAYAERLLAEALSCLPQSRAALAWLAARGITLEAAQAYRLGYLPEENAEHGRFRPRAALGLTPYVNPKTGRQVNSIFIPRGIVIPAFDASGRLIRLRTRRPAPDLSEGSRRAAGAQAPDLSEGSRKYMVLEGSNPVPMLLPSSRPAHLAAYVVVEAELDAMLLHSLTGGALGVFAALTNRGKPDAAQHTALQESACILNALDYDPREVTQDDGTVLLESPGASGWEWWRDTYRQARRWPVPQAKDPGDAWASGVDMLAWLRLGLPRSVRLPDNPAQTGAQEPLAPGVNFMGGGGEARTEPAPEKEGDCTHSHASLQMAVGCLDADAERLALLALWRREAPGLELVKTASGALCPALRQGAATEWSAAERVFARIQSSMLFTGIIKAHTAKLLTPENIMEDAL